MIQSNKKIEPVEYYSRSLELFRSSLDSYIKSNIQLVQSIETKWLNSQERAKNTCKEYQDSNVEDIFASVYIDLVNDFLSDLEIINNTILNVDSRLPFKK